MNKAWRWWTFIYVLAGLTVVGRIGYAWSGHHFIHDLLGLTPFTSDQAIGYRVERLLEDLIILIAIIGIVRKKPFGRPYSPVPPPPPPPSA